MLILSASCAGCSPFAFKDPHSGSFSEVTIAIGDGTNGSAQGEYALEVKEFTTPFTALVLADATLYRDIYLKAGSYRVDATCRRDWATPDNGQTTRLPYGLGTDDRSEHFDITIEPHKKYVLDCTPGMDKSTFFLREIPGN